MNDDLNLQLSQLIDDELAKTESVKLLELVHKQPDLEAKLNRYSLVGNVIKSDSFVHTESGFVGKVSQSIAQEAVVFAPVWRQRKSGVQTLSAIAASIAIIAIIGYGGVKLAPDTLQPSITTASVEPAKTIAIKPKQKVITVANNNEKGEVDPRFIEYLEAHDNSLYAAGSPGYQSYVRVVKYGQK